MNHTFIAGRLGQDPETRFTSSGQKVTTLRVACNSKRSGKEETIWWRVTLWGDQFDKILTFFKKGSAIMVMGEMAKPEIFNDRDGKPQVSMNLTAYNISFSPFGSGQKGEEGGMGSGSQGGMGQGQGGFGGGQQGFGGGQGGNQGNGQGFGAPNRYDLNKEAQQDQNQGFDNPFLSGKLSEEEIPF